MCKKSSDFLGIQGRYAAFRTQAEWGVHFFFSFFRDMNFLKIKFFFSFLRTWNFCEFFKKEMHIQSAVLPSYRRDGEEEEVYCRLPSLGEVFRSF